MSRNLRFKDESELRAFLQRSGKSPSDAAALAAAAGVKGSKKRSNKLGAQRCQHDGIDFDSKHEGERYLLLKQRMKAKEIRALAVHVPLPCEVRGVLVCTLMIDFVYERLWTDDELKAAKALPQKCWRKIHEDAKGYKGGATYALFKLKKKLAEAVHGITIDEV